MPYFDPYIVLYCIIALQWPALKVYMRYPWNPWFSQEIFWLWLWLDTGKTALSAGYIQEGGPLKQKRS